MDQRKRVIYIGSSQAEVNELPDAVREDVLDDLAFVAIGRRNVPVDAIQMVGEFSGVMELRKPYDDNTYRTFYVAKWSTGIYVLYSHIKKSNENREMTPQDRKRLARRLSVAKQTHEQLSAKKRKGNRR